MAAVNDIIQQQLAERLVEAARIAEDEIDREIERLEKLDEDDLEGKLPSLLVRGSPAISTILVNKYLQKSNG